MGLENVMCREQWLLEEDIARNPLQRRMFAAGWRARSYVKFRNHRRWALEALRRGHVKDSLHQAARAAGDYLRFARILATPNWRTPVAAMNATERSRFLVRQDSDPSREALQAKAPR
jgi:hypothetical protein